MSNAVRRARAASNGRDRFGRPDKTVTLIRRGEDEGVSDRLLNKVLGNLRYFPSDSGESPWADTAPH